jgi:hypothetical protein
LELYDFVRKDELDKLVMSERFKLDGWCKGAVMFDIEVPSLWVRK